MNISQVSLQKAGERKKRTLIQKWFSKLFYAITWNFWLENSEATNYVIT